MTTQELVEHLKVAQKLSEDDEERAHIVADNLLLQFINNPEITAAFEAVKKWYA